MIRLDRMVTLHLVHPFRQRNVRRDGVRVPILMYHSISETHSNGRHPYFETATSPRTFAEHMKALHQNGYRTISLEEARHRIESGGMTTEPLVVLTFDDGLRDFYTQAFPLLQVYGFIATVFLPTGYIGAGRCRFNGRDCLTWAEVRELHTSGITFGSHTVNHKQLRGLSLNDLEQEIRCSKETIEDRLGHSVSSFSYPFAFPEADRRFTRVLEEILASAGYRIGVTTIIGSYKSGTNRYRLPRLPVSDHDDRRLLSAKLDGSYDWVHWPQRMYKKTKEYWRASRA